jgi:hypothetical protein
MSRLPHFLDNRPTDDSEVFGLTCRLRFTHRKISGTHFCLRLSRCKAHSAAGRIRPTEKSNYLIGNVTSDLPACSIAPLTRTNGLMLFREARHCLLLVTYLTKLPTSEYITWYGRMTNRLLERTWKEGYPGKFKEFVWRN